ncbi:MAG: protein kinase [Hyphomonadaceae bacterium]|nr:protein kinase [Hyphomonadaceae bacterium]
MKCPNCQSEIPADARFCGECGQSMRQLGKSLVEESSSSGPDLSGLRTIDDMETKTPRGESQRMMQPGEVFAGRYEVSKVIGEGGMGVVYRAHDKLTEKDVALKLIRADRLAGKDAVKRLIREGVTSRDIRHPNVVAVYDVGDADGQPYMSMEFLGGQSLRAWNRKRLQSSSDCSMRAAANIIAEILSGLDAAHKAGVVHRDLKPENVMLIGEPNDQGAQLKILDFGVARAAGAGDTGATSLGTRGYMAPEQITAPDAAQPSADLYSLSVMFYELLVGVVPQGHWQPPSGGRSDVPPAIDKLIERGLSNNPRIRPQNVAEYGKLLAEAMKSGGGNLSNAFAPWLEKIEQSGFKPLADGIKSNLDKVGLHAQPQQHQPQPTGPNSGAGAAPPSGKKNMWQWFTYSVTKRYLDGKGRAHRMEYWSFLLMVTAIYVITMMVDAEIFAQSFGTTSDYMFEAMAAGMYQPPLTGIVSLALVAPLLAVSSRRLHDIGVSGWLAIACIIPFIAIAVGFPAGKKGENQYGPDPLDGAG